MERLLALLSLLAFVVVASQAVVPGEEYWNKVLPKTPMPSAIKDLLRDDKSGTVVTVGKGGVNVNTGKPGGTTVNVGPGGVGVHTGKGTNVNVGGAHGGGVNVNTGKGTSVNVGKGGVNVNTGGKGGKPSGTSVNVGHGGVGVHTGKGTNVNVGGGHGGGVNVNTGKGKPGGTTVNVGKGGVRVGVTTPPKKKPVFVNVSPFDYLYAATETQIRDDPTVALFFLQKDLKAGTKMTLDFSAPSGTSTAAFISRREADATPFSSAQLPQILHRFSVDPASAEAASMKQTLSECEMPAMEGESKYCATSLESMVEFTTSSLGTRNVAAVSTAVDKESPPKQLYTIESSGAVKKLAGSNLVVCHAQKYAYAVFYCHTAQKTEAYEVSMVGSDGTKVDAVAVCHTDTAAWNPKHVAFRVLSVKPGTVPVCHFLPQDHLVWSPKK